MIQLQHTIIGCINLCFTHVLLHYNRKLFITLIRIHKLPRLHPKELKLVIDTRIYSLLSFNDMCVHSNNIVDIHQRITYYSNMHELIFFCVLCINKLQWLILKRFWLIVISLTCSYDNVTFFLSGFKILGLMAKYTDMSLKYAGGLLVMPTTTIVQQKNSSVWFFVPYMLQG